MDSDELHACSSAACGTLHDLMRYAGVYCDVLEVPSR
jgi:hypothetical protein